MDFWIGIGIGFQEMDRYGNYYYQGSGLWRSLRDGDFEESEVWDVLTETKDRTLSQASPPGGISVDRHAPVRTPSAPKTVIRSTDRSGGSSTPRSIFTHQSAPVNIPNLTNAMKNLGRSESSKAPQTKSRPWRLGDEDVDDEDDPEDEDDDDDEEDAYGHRLAPHEYIAMRLARSKTSSFSVFEGIGRKLKGRDLSKVRNDVLSKTGFLEFP